MKHISIKAPQAEATGRVLLVEDDDKCSRLHSRWQPKQPSQDRNSGIMAQTHQATESKS